MPCFFLQTFQTINTVLQQSPQSLALGLIFISLLFHGLYFLVQISIGFILILIIFLQFLVEGHLGGNLILLVFVNSIEVGDFPRNLINADIVLMHLHFEPIELVPELGDISPGDVGLNSKWAYSYLYSFSILRLSSCSREYFDSTLFTSSSSLMYSWSNSFSWDNYFFMSAISLSFIAASLFSYMDPLRIFYYLFYFITRFSLLYQPIHHLLFYTILIL